jgi:hypothetical protein
VLKTHTTRVTRRSSAFTSNMKHFPSPLSFLLQAIRTLTCYVIRIPPGTLFTGLLTSRQPIGILGPSKRDHRNPFNKPPPGDWSSSLSPPLPPHTNTLVTASVTRQFPRFAWFVTGSHPVFHGYGRASFLSDVTTSVLTDGTTFSRSGERMVDHNSVSSHHVTRQASL